MIDQKIQSWGFFLIMMINYDGNKKLPLQLNASQHGIMFED